MSWACNYIKQLNDGQTIRFRPRGNSMKGKINSGDLCTVEPLKDDSILKKNDIVLCSVNGNDYLHLVKSIKGNQYKIANNKGFINGTISRNNIFGKCIKIEK